MHQNTKNILKCLAIDVKEACTTGTQNICIVCLLGTIDLSSFTKKMRHCHCISDRIKVNLKLFMLLQTSVKKEEIENNLILHGPLDFVIV